MKLIADDGAEYEVTSRSAGYALIKKLLPDMRLGIKKGDHIEKWDNGSFRFRFFSNGKDHYGPSRRTREEALDDLRRTLAGEPVAAPVRGSEEFRRKVGLGRIRAHVVARDASPDGREHLSAPTCSFCKELGHKASYCEKRKAALAERVTWRAA